MDTTRLDLNLLVTLEALLSECNVTRAGARLGLSQPAVSAQLARLRDLFEDPLLLPAHRGMVPTARALELHEPLRQALDHVRSVIAHRKFDPLKARLTIAIAASDYVQAAVLQPLVIDLRRRAPGLRLALRPIDAVQLGDQMTRGSVDLALMTLDGAPPGLRSRRLFDESYVLVARVGHPRARKGMSPAQFAALEHVVVSPRGGGFATAVDTALATLGLRRTVVLSGASFLFVPEIVAQTDFVALVPRRLVDGRQDRLLAIDCPFPVAGFTIAMLWHERNHSHPAQRWVRERLIEATSADHLRRPSDKSARTGATGSRPARKSNPPRVRI